MNHLLHELLVRNNTDTLRRVLRHVGEGDYSLTPRDASKLIEGIILRVPFQPVHGVETPQGKPVYRVGLDRLTALRSYINGEWSLEGCTGAFAELNGKTFSKLPGLLQARIEDLYVVAYVVDSRVPAELVTAYFERV